MLQTTNWKRFSQIEKKGLNQIPLQINLHNSETAFVRSLVRKSGKKSLLKYEENNSSFYENTNCNSFVQLESIRSNNELWYSNYKGILLMDNYGISTQYVNSRHNDNIFRGQRL